MEEVEHMRYKATSKEYDIKMVCRNIHCRDGLKLLSGFDAISQEDGTFELIATWSRRAGGFPHNAQYKIYPVISDEFVEFYKRLKWVEIKE